ncbi:MAG: T9SS type A sorting domain-containing protein [Chitinophagales bacterium]
MKKLLLIVILLQACSIYSQSLNWYVPIGTESEPQHITKVIINGQQIIICGIYSGLPDFDPGPDVQTPAVSGTNDLFIASYGFAGDFNWVTPIPYTNYANINFLNADINGDIYITGSFEGAIYLDGITPLIDASSPGTSDIFIGKYDDTGNYIWGYAAGSVANDGIGGFDTDPSGNFYLSGFYSNEMNFGLAGPPEILPAPGSNIPDLYFAKYNSDGELIWINSFGIDGSSDLGMAIKYDAVDNTLILTGVSHTGADFDPGAGVHSITSMTFDLFFARYNADGEYIFAKPLIGTNGSNTIGEIGLNNKRDIILYGNYAATLDFDPGAAVANKISTGGNFDIFIATYKSAGGYKFANTLRGDDNPSPQGFDQLRTGKYFLAGGYLKNVDFDLGATTYLLPYAYLQKPYFAEYTSTGGLLWVYPLTITTPTPTATGSFSDVVMEGGTGQLICTGHFISTIDLEPLMDNTFYTSGPTYYDAFIASYDVSELTAAFRFSSSVDEANNLIIYPQPASNEMIITGIDDNFPLIDENITIYNMDGKKLDVPFIISENSMLIDVNDLPDGMYIFSVKNDLKIRTGKFIIQH